MHCVHPYSCPGSLVYRHMPSTKGLCDKVQQLNLIDFLIIVYLNGFDQVHNVQSTFLSTWDKLESNIPIENSAISWLCCNGQTGFQKQWQITAVANSVVGIFVARLETRKFQPSTLSPDFWLFLDQDAVTRFFSILLWHFITSPSVKGTLIPIITYFNVEPCKRKV